MRSSLRGSMLDEQAHPFAPLTVDEIQHVVDGIRADKRCPENHSFRLVATREPTRSELRALRDLGRPLARRTEVALFDVAEKVMHHVTIDLDAGVVVEWAQLDASRQPGFSTLERPRVQEAVRNDPTWQAAMRRRGVTDYEHVAFETGPGGRFGSRWDGRRRIGRTLTFLRPPGTINYYAHPVQGLLVFTDLSSYEVLEVVDEGVVDIPSQPSEFHTHQNDAARPPLRPIEIRQPEGPSFTVDGGLITWQGWSFHVSLHPIDGLVLHEISYEDNGRTRSILHRAGLAEMVVPYGDPSVNQYWRNSFDVAEGGIGRNAQSLELGCDCLGDITYLDAAVVNEDGTARHIANAICVHEEDWNVSWKHVYVRDSVSTARRSRRLVVSCWATLGNYDYGFFWYFYTEGHLECEVKPTGIVFPGAAPPSSTNHLHGELVAPGIYAPHHQHLFCFRLDPAIDGPKNTVYELDVVPGAVEGTHDPYGVAFHVQRDRLERETDGKRDVDPHRSRTWLIANDGVRNDLGSPVGFNLIPHQSATLLANPESTVSRLAAFAHHNFWVTAYDPDQCYPAGDYPAWGDTGIDQWINADRSIADTEIVVWHCFSATHIARPEDWPVMPVEHVGFALKPFGFFRRNPALDLPAPEHACHPNDAQT